MAEKIDVDERVLGATVEEYNKFCAQGHDELFAKEPRFLQPVRAPTYYAIRGYPSFTGTIGGIKSNHKAEVVDENHEVIPGLYAAGNCAGGLYGDSYELSTTGGALGFALISGRIAAENALEYIGE